MVCDDRAPPICVILRCVVGVDGRMVPSDLFALQADFEAPHLQQFIVRYPAPVKGVPRTTKYIVRVVVVVFVYCC